MKAKPKDLLTIYDVAERLGVSPQTVRMLCQSGRLKAANISSSTERSVWVVSPANYESFVNGEPGSATKPTKRLGQKIKRV